jgi:hypothetical protein
MKVVKIIGKVAMGIGFLSLYTFLVMQLWNCLMPSVFGLPILTFFQSLGLIVLLKLLFLGNGWGGHHRKEHFLEHRFGNHKRKEEWKRKFCEKYESEERKQEEQ